MILAAGLGERLRPETNVTPKPLFRLGGTNMIRNAIGYLLRHGITDIAINLHHLGSLIKDDLAKNPPKGARIFFVEEKTLMGTGGGIKGAEQFIGGKDFVVINSDVLTDLDLGEAMRYHRSKNALATLVTRKNPDPEKIGSLAEGDGGRLVRFLGSKSPIYHGENEDAKLMFTGIHVLSKEFWGRIPGGRPVNISTEVYAPLVAAGEAIYVFNHDGYWADIGTPRTYRDACEDVKNGKFKPYAGD
jgi:NDP-sugar pyrophosphorylase family protein